MKNIKNELEKAVEKIANDLENTQNLEEYIEEEALDCLYTISSGGQYQSVKVYLGIGGPAYWIDTAMGVIRGAWGTEESICFLHPNIIDEIDDVFEENYHYLKTI